MFVFTVNSTKNARILFSRIALKDIFTTLKTRDKDVIYLFVFVALRPKSTAMVIAGRSVHLTTLFPGQA